MFTGIIEAFGTIQKIEKEASNIHFYIQSPLSNDLKIDQSVSHNGVCLTVVGIDRDVHQVTAIQETLNKTTLGRWSEGDIINLERCTLAGARLDGHIVQGHVDQTAKCISRIEADGSWIFTFKHDSAPDQLTVEKGSITVDGISLTVIDSQFDRFSVAIIPYTFDHTNLKNIQVDDYVNLEFDIIGKYVAKLMEYKIRQEN